MIKLTRVDHRLIHGQVAFSWTKFLGINLILIPSDTVVNDELRKDVLRMAKPSNVKLIIKTIDECIEAINTGKTDKYNMLILLETVEDAYRLASQVEKIKNFRSVIKDFPLIVGAGVTDKNIHKQLEIADGAIVGSYLKDSYTDNGEVSKEHVEQMVKLFKEIRSEN